MKYRIIKPAEYTFLHYLQQYHWLWGWMKIHTGSKQECNHALDCLMKHNEMVDVIRQETTK